MITVSKKMVPTEVVSGRATLRGIFCKNGKMIAAFWNARDAQTFIDVVQKVSTADDFYTRDISLIADAAE